LAQDTTEAGRAKTRRLGGYELLSKVGRGGMGVVYKARQLSMNRLVAIKILAPRLARNKEYIGRFIREAQAVGRLNHRNIVQGLEAGERDGFYYFAMEYVDGETVHQMIMREGALKETLALNIVRDVARALSHAHRVGLVHRDIKPGNIMLTRGGVTKLCDLGLAREKDRGTAAPGKAHVAVGTPYYISPEQAMGQDNADIRSDIYSLGATLFRMVVGDVPFDGESPGEILSHHIQTPLPWPSHLNPNVSDNTSRLIAKMMAKDPKERYQTPSELVEDIERVLEGKPPLSADVALEAPAVTGAEESTQKAARIQRRRDALRKVYEIRVAAREAAREQNVRFPGLVTHLRGNLDEEDPQTHLKYGVLLLSEGDFEAARLHFRTAREKGAEVEAHLARLNLLATPAGMVYIPSGEETLGPPDRPVTVRSVGFYMDVHPVTNAEYARFVEANAYPPPAHWGGKRPPAGLEDHPVVGVSWDDARAYAIWAGKELPTSVQWERAARGGDGRAYPWGEAFDPARCNTREGGPGRTTPVGEYDQGVSPRGCADMAGNVWEWLRDVPPSKKTEDQRTAAGGSWEDPQEHALCYYRRRLDRSTRDRKTGFRCMKPL